MQAKTLLIISICKTDSNLLLVLQVALFRKFINDVIQIEGGLVFLTEVNKAYLQRDKLGRPQWGETKNVLQ